MIPRALLCGALLLCCLASAPAAPTPGYVTVSARDFCCGAQPVRLEQLWLLHTGDDSAWADPALDDRDWRPSPTAFPLRDVLESRDARIGWFRLHVTLDSTVQQQPLFLDLSHFGPVEAYWDGKRVYALGTVAGTPAAERPMVRFYGEPVRLETTGPGEHVLVIRYSIQHARQLLRTGVNAGFYAKLFMGRDQSLSSLQGQDLRLLGWSLVAGLSLTLMVLHLIIYLLFRRLPENFDFALFAGSAFAFAVLVLVTYILVPLTFDQFAFRVLLQRIALLYMPLAGLHFMHAVAGTIGHNRRNKWLFLTALAVAAILAALAPLPLVYLSMVLLSAELLRAFYLALRRRVERVWILGLGFGTAILMTVLMTLVAYGLIPGGPWVEFTAITSLAILMLSASVYLGSKVAALNQSLEAKIDEGRRAVRALAESEARYRSIVENPIVGVGIVDDTNRIIYVNNRYLEIVRTPREEVVSGDFRKRIAPEYLDEINTKVGRLYRGDVATVTAEFDISAGDGVRRTILASASLYRTRQGKRHMVVHITDLTDVRESERKQREALSLAEQTARMASIGVMAGGITHEINQPLNAIMLHAETLQFMANANRLDQTQPVTTALDHIVMGTERISEIIQHMRSFWLDGPSAAELRRVDLNNPVRQAVRMNEQKVHAHAIDLALELSEQPLYVRADALQLEQIVINLLTNAINALDRASKKGKRITLCTFEKDGEILLEVRDNGTGLPPIEPEKLFDPFFSTGKEKGGTGLGLAIVKMFVEKFRGKVTAENNADGGATFCVRLPADTNAR